jgi:hypothetical protein
MSLNSKQYRPTTGAVPGYEYYYSDDEFEVIVVKM